MAGNSKSHSLGFIFSGSEFFFSKDWELEIRSIIGKEFERASIFVDVGANHGIYTCWAAARGLRVAAVEPEQANLRFLLNNVRQNDLSVEIFPVALSNVAGTAQFFGDGDTASMVRGWASVKPSFVQTVPINTLDNLFAGRWAGEQLLIKVDVEGFELSVLQGASQMLVRNPRPIWIIETFPLNYDAEKSVNATFPKIFSILQDAGYRATRIGTGEEVTPEILQRWTSDPEAYDSSKSNFLFQGI